MIGKPLTRDRMSKVLHGLADLEQPWNCPHGRPTLRHLVDLRDLERDLGHDLARDGVAGAGIAGADEDARD